MSSSEKVIAFLRTLQQHICSELEQADGTGKFMVDEWQSTLGTGVTRVLKDGNVFEQAGVNFSHVKGDTMPASATAHRPELTGASWEAMGVSLVVHPKNPYVPTSHANVRCFFAYPKDGGEPVWWFGGGFDLTPFYPHLSDVQHWHEVAALLCEPFGDNVYAEHKKWCDEYFYLKHRGEARGVGGIFFDDFAEPDVASAFATMKSVGDAFLAAYVPLVEKHRDDAYDDAHKNWQNYRRGRYVEFNLVFDRGTHFGLQSGGRTESILMSMPPVANWAYQYTPAADSDEMRLLTDFLPTRNWLAT